ncbi:hypothetical protein JOQ06_023744 [Pogonophryne albipinna]|uniref:DDE Tnp4 domain-containing protein n=1 Tax=Pogonophryne albipinna TaxID=1090488 RepID=A0AAD6FS20_9TELE|nr:hypothetical protein JOQ06_023744 [Pogonophryne albipinna]
MPLLSRFLSQLDLHSASLLRVFSKQSGQQGKKLKDMAAMMTEDIDASRECLIKGLCIYLNEDPEDLVKEYLATGDSYRTIAFSYRVGFATVAVIAREVAGAIWTALVEETMPVPQTEDWRAIAAEFQERWNFPNCVGAIDGKHVVIQAPANSGSLYFNYKSTHSLVLLAVVDAQYLFRVVDVGGFGRSSDSESLRNFAFGEGLRDGSLQLPPDTVIPGAERLGLLPHVFVGDEAFPLLDNLLRPFPGRQLTRERRLFNYRHSRARLVVECAFGILSSQWRMFRRVITTSPEEDTRKAITHTCRRRVE